MNQDLMNYLQGERAECNRIIEQWDTEAPESESDTPRAARERLKSINGALLALSGSASEHLTLKAAEAEVMRLRRENCKAVNLILILLIAVSIVGISAVLVVVR
jgi:hypothetical protein